MKRPPAILRHAEEMTGNVAMTSATSVTRQSFSTWTRRYEELGREGLSERSWRPKVSPRATHVDVVGKISTSASKRGRAGRDGPSPVTSGN